MAISQKTYVNIATSVTGEAVNEREFAGLVFTDDAILTTSAVPGTIQTAYDAGKVLTLTASEVAAYFADTAKVYAFANRYFGYTSTNGRTPTKLRVVKMIEDSTTTTTETAVVAFNRVVAEDNNFGSFTFLATVTGLGDVANANAAMDNMFLFCVPCTTSDVATVQAAVANIAGTHVVLGSDAYAAWMPMAWVASIDFTQTNGTGTMFGKQFGSEVATVTTDSDKSEKDAIKVNYIGLTMTNGSTYKFYQNGINQDGVDTGVYVNEMYLKSRIATEYMNLLTSVPKIPANSTGAVMILNIIVEIANSAVDSGIILIDKQFTASDIAKINLYSGNDTEAVNAVRNSGFYATTWIEKIGNAYVCKYRLIYAKGDHIHKLEGVNYLI